MNKKKKPLYFYYLIILLVVVMINGFMSTWMMNSRLEEVTYNVFQDAMRDKKIDEVQVENETITYTIKDDEAKKQYYTGNMQDPNLTTLLSDAGAKFNRIYPQEMNPILYMLLTFLLPVLLLWGLGNMMFKRMQKKMGNDGMTFGGGGLGGFGKSNAQVYVEAQSGKRFSDVAGQDEAKEALLEMVDFLKNPKKYGKRQIQPI